MTKRRVSVRITGDRSGVCFRAETMREARRLGLDGFVRNRPDGSVEVVAQGEGAAVEALITWCRAGPPLARVANVGVTEEDPTAAGPGFHISWC